MPDNTDYTICPAQDRIKDVYSRCDAWLVASRSEGFGLPILEAMACRTPVIATPTGAAPELLAPGGGVIVPMEDPTAMAAAIERIIGLPDDQWRRMSDIAYDTATRYTWDDATKLFEAALHRACQKAVVAP
jgi:glycosyltransferase involved in cell wall biosynthesis